MTAGSAVSNVRNLGCQNQGEKLKPGIQLLRLHLKQERPVLGLLLAALPVPSEVKASPNGSFPTQHPAQLPFAGVSRASNAFYIFPLCSDKHIPPLNSLSALTTCLHLHQGLSFAEWL